SGGIDSVREDRRSEVDFTLGYVERRQQPKGFLATAQRQHTTIECFRYDRISARIAVEFNGEHQTFPTHVDDLLRIRFAQSLLGLPTARDGVRHEVVFVDGFEREQPLHRCEDIAAAECRTEA